MEGDSLVIDNKTAENVQEDNEPEEEKSEKLVQLPISRIKTIMKLDPDFHMASQEAVFLIARSTEMFVEALTKEAYNFTVQAKRRTLQKKDLDRAIESADCLAFLEGVLETL